MMAWRDCKRRQVVFRIVQATSISVIIGAAYLSFKWGDQQSSPFRFGSLDICL